MAKSSKGSDSDRSQGSDDNSNRNVQKPQARTTSQNRQNQQEEAVAYQEKYLDDLLKIPPNWRQANRHGKRSHVGRALGDMKENRGQTESVANIGPEKQMYPLCIRYKDVKECGSGIPLLYQFKLWTILVYIIMFIPCVYSLIINYGMDRASQFTQTPSWIVNFTLGNFGYSSSIDDDDQILMNIQVYLHMATIVAIVFLSICLKGLQKRLELQVDQNAQTPNDYAIYLRNIPLNQDEESVKQWVEKEWQNYRVEVQYANMIYDVGNLINSNRNLTIWRTKESLYKLNKNNNRQNLIQKGYQPQNIRDEDIQPVQTKCGCCKSKIDYKQIRENVEKYQNQIDEYYKNVNIDEGEQKNIGKLFVVFKNQRDVRFLDEQYDQSVAGKIWFFFVAKFCCRKTSGYPEYQYKNESGSIKKNRVYLSRAPQPTDVYWENLGVTACQRFSTILVTYSLTVLLLGIVFAISYALNVYKTGLQQDYNKKKILGTQNFTDLITVRGVSFLTSIIVVIFNNTLIILIRKFSSSEKHETHTKYNLSVAFKMTVATFVNSAIIPLVVNIDQNTDWFANGGLVVDIFYNFVSIGFVTPLLYIFDTFFIIRFVKRCCAQRKGGNSKLTQKQANELMEGPPVDMARRNSNTFLLFMMTIFYAPIQPLAVIIALIGAIFTYWVDKCILLRRHKQPPAVGPEITFFYGSLIPWALLLYAFSAWFWVFRVGSTGANTPAAILCFVLFGFLVFPVRSCMKCCYGQNAEPSKLTHENAAAEFLTDYRYQNPVTRAQATAKLLEEKYGLQLVPEQGQDGQALTQQQRKQKLKQLKKNEIFKSCMAYGNNRKGLQSQAQDLQISSGPQSSILFALAERKKKAKGQGNNSGILGALLSGNKKKKKEEEKENVDDQKDSEQNNLNNDGAFLLLGLLNPSQDPSSSRLQNNVKTFKKQQTYKPPAPILSPKSAIKPISEQYSQQQHQQQQFQPRSYIPPSPSHYVPPPSAQQVAQPINYQQQQAIHGHGYGQQGYGHHPNQPHNLQGYAGYGGYGGYGRYGGGYIPQHHQGHNLYQAPGGYNAGGYGGQQPYYR